MHVFSLKRVKRIKGESLNCNGKISQIVLISDYKEVKKVNFKNRPQFNYLAPGG